MCVLLCIPALLCGALQVRANSMRIVSPRDLAAPAAPAEHDALRMQLAADPTRQLSSLCEAVATCMRPMQAPQDLLLALLLSAAVAQDQPQGGASPAECTQASNKP